MFCRIVNITSIFRALKNHFSTGINKNTVINPNSTPDAPTNPPLTCPPNQNNHDIMAVYTYSSRQVVGPILF